VRRNLLAEASDQEEVFQRLNQLERQNRVLRVWAGVVGLILIAFLLRASPLESQEKPGKVEGTAFVLRDDEGRTRATLSGLNGGGAAVSFYDTKKNLRLLVGLRSGGQPSIQLNDGNEVGRGVFGLDENDAPGCDLNDRQGRRRLRLNVADREGGQPSALTFYDTQGKARVALMNAEKLSGLTLAGPDEELRSVVGAGSNGMALSMILGKDGKTLWSAP
jgi:hypothetical protein